MNPVFDTECSSGGCESGWTLYLDHDSFLSPYPPSRKSGNEYFMTDEKRGKHDEEEEDLSMVSDASSGPPHFDEDGDYGNDNNKGLFYHAPVNATLPQNNGNKRQKNKEHRRQKIQEQQLCFLDDTASSSISDFSGNNLALTNNQPSMETILDYSQGHSTTHFEGKSRFQEHYGFFKSPASGTQLQQNQWFERKKVGMR